MADLLVRRLDDTVKSRLKRRATKHGRSLEAEAREILVAASEEVVPSDGLKPGESLGERMEQRFGRRGLTKSEAALFNSGIAEINSPWETEIGSLFD